MDLQKHTETIPDQRTNLLAFAEHNAMYRDANAANFYSKANVDISADKRNKLSGDYKLIQRIAEYLDRGLDFGLKNDADGYIFFIRRQWMITYNPKDSNQNSVFNLANITEFENRLKVAVLFHPHFVTPAQIRNNIAYNYIIKNLP